MSHPQLPEPPAYRRFITTSLRARGLLLQLVPPVKRDRELCRLAVRQDGQALAYVPFALRDQRLCRDAVLSGALDILHLVPTALRTAALCRQAVARDGNALRHVPFPLRTRALCESAVRNGRDVLRDVPHRFRDPALCIAALPRLTTLEHVPVELLESRGFRHIILQGYRSALVHLPPESLTGSDLLEHVRHFPDHVADALRLLPDVLPDAVTDAELAQTAARLDGAVLERLPEELLTREVCEAAIMQTPRVLGSIPLPLREEAICRLALEQDGMAIQETPPALWSHALCELALDRGWDLSLNNPFDPGRFSLQLEDETLLETGLNEELCLLAMRKIAQDERLALVPEALRTPNVCREAVTQDGYSLWFVPDALLNRDLCLAAMQKCGDALHRVPPVWRDREMCETALRSATTDLTADIPDEMLRLMPANQRHRPLSRLAAHELTARSCETALRRNAMAWEWVPPERRDRRLCRLLARRHGRLDLAPESQRDWALVTEAIRRNALLALPHIPTDLFNPDFDPSELEGESGARMDAATECVRPYGLYRTHLAEELHILVFSGYSPVHGKADLMEWDA